MRIFFPILQLPPCVLLISIALLKGMIYFFMLEYFHALNEKNIYMRGTIGYMYQIKSAKGTLFSCTGTSQNEEYHQ